MGAKMDESKSETVKVRLTPSVRGKCKEARDSGSWSGRTESDFFGYLIELGLVRYERSILPVERGEDLPKTFIGKLAEEIGIVPPPSEKKQA